MLTKTLKFDADVMAIIGTMEWRDDGKQGVLTCGPLERKLYESVNKALVAMGGKWRRGIGAHVFPMDPRPTVDGLLEDGHLIVERDGFFETPLEIVSRMIELVAPIGRVLEPSAGLGAIAERLPVAKDQLLCIEKNPRRCEVLEAKGYTVQCGDFLTMDPGTFDAIFMNPPFEEGQEIDHVKHAYRCLASGGAMVSVMSVGPFFRADRKATDFREWFEHVHGVKTDNEDNSFKISGTGVNTCLVVIRNRC